MSVFLSDLPQPSGKNTSLSCENMSDVDVFVDYFVPIQECSTKRLIKENSH